MTSHSPAATARLINRMVHLADGLGAGAGVAGSVDQGGNFPRTRRRGAEAGLTRRRPGRLSQPGRWRRPR
ncbi:MAG: hypothetical protein OXG35_23440, partial [Acidobacteria bacterium]|nr:hypothetical protein [Acidobacteriota bacterium]